MEEEEEYTPPVRQTAKPAVKISKPSNDDDDEAMSYFKKIAMEE